jgi:hypothetical protein
MLKLPLASVVEVVEAVPLVVTVAAVKPVMTPERLKVVAAPLVPAAVVAVLDVLDVTLAIEADAAELEEELALLPPPHALNVTQVPKTNAVSSRLGRFIESPFRLDSFRCACCRGKIPRAQSVAGTRPFGIM